MKKLIFFIGILLCAGNLLSQAPNAFKYQAIARDLNGDLIVNQNVGVLISIIQNSTNGIVKYAESHSVTTNQFGLIDLEVGNGTTTSGNFSTIDWAQGPYFLKVEMDISGGTNYQIMGVSQLLSVPYALYAEQSGSTLTGQGISSYTQIEIDNLNASSGTLVFNTTTNCLNFFNGNDWVELCGDLPCTPMPTIAEAGPTQSIYGTSTTLEGNTPVNGVGQWVGSGGNIQEPGNPNSSITGTPGQTYLLFWTISTPCGSSTDSVLINFLVCNDGNPCTEDYWLNGACYYDPILLNVANAGPDQQVYGNSVDLTANVATAGGTGIWSIVSGQGGQFSNSLDPNATFSGQDNSDYTLVWKITDSCWVSTDTIEISFFNCYNPDPCMDGFYDSAGDSCYDVPVSPTQAFAGDDQLIYTTNATDSTTLEATEAFTGVGYWTVVSGAGGIFDNPANYATTFTGNINTIYTLQWQVSHACDTTSDEVTIIFTNCDDGDPCTNDYFSNGTCHNDPILPTTADAGTDQTINNNSTTLAANAPLQGTGVWSVISPSGANPGFIDINDPQTTFTGNYGISYILEWTITNGTCGSSSDQVQISFIDCDDQQACTLDEWDAVNQVCVHTPITIPVANAGADQSNVPSPATLDGNDPGYGEGTWSIWAGMGGAIADSSDNNSLFTGILGNSYTLVWEIDHECQTTTDTVIITIGAAFQCGTEQLVDTRDNQTYNTVEINGRCWMAENLNYGTFVTSTNGMSDNQLPEKYCYANTATNCDTKGGLYAWAELMNYSTADSAQGLCPEGWHVPSDAEWFEMENFVDPTVNDPTTTGFRGTDIHTKLLSGGTSGLDLIYSGMYHAGNSAFYGGGSVSQFAIYATSTLISNATWIRTIQNGSTGVSRSDDSQFNGTAVRCLKDENTVPCSPMPSQADAGPDQLNVTGTSVTLAAVSPVEGTGQWSSTGGSFSDTLSNTATFSGTPGQSYELTWTVSTLCGTTSDDVTISFEDTSSFICGNIFTDTRDNQTYNTVEINGRCWMAENLNYGTIVTTTQGQANNSTVEKYCYNNDPTKCNTLGGLYNWNELMDYSTADSAQGICPVGWHVPSDNEWYTLENFLDPTVNDPTATNFRGIDIHTKLMPNGSSGMDLLYCGTYYQPNGAFYGAGPTNNFGNYATSTQNSNLTWIRTIIQNEAGVSRTAELKLLGTAVRCIKDDVVQPCSPQPSQANAGNDQTNVAADSVILAAQVPAEGTGQWSITSGSSGTFSDINSNTSIFYGSPGQGYELTWTVTTICGSTSDVVLISFANSGSFSCGTTFTDIRDNQTYATIDINGQCWFADNLNYGNFVTTTQGQSNNSIPEKYCYANIQTNCDTRGGLYTWDELMNYSTADSAQGLCPDGWHVASDAEWFTLESFLDPTVSDPTAIGYRGTDIHTKLLPNGSSGFNMIFTGTYYAPNAAFYGGGSSNQFANYATSTENIPKTWVRTIAQSGVGVSRTAELKTLGNPVRCIKDEGSVPCSPQPDQANAGPDQLDVTGNSVTLAANSPAEGTGQWSGGSGGSFSNIASNTSTFTGVPGQSYQLTWTVSNQCGSNSDNVQVSFADTSSWACGADFTDARDNQTYATVLIDNRCWFAENLNYGTFVTTTQGQSNNSTPEKYCYGNVQGNCNTNGGLYTWDELMNYSTADSAQGLCPDGWHVASDAEWYALENYVDPTVNDPTATNFRGTDLHTKLLPGGTSGFNILYSGTYYAPNSAFYGGGTTGQFGIYATSTEAVNNNWTRTINENFTGISRTAETKLLGNAVRCIKNEGGSQPPCSPQPSQADAGADQIDVNGTSTTLAAIAPTSGTGQWTILSGTNGNVTDIFSITSTFTGIAGESYVLEWTVTTACGSTSDQVNISFDLCSPQPSQADAGPDQVNVTGTSTTLAAIAPTAGTGQWSILSGSGGNVLDVSSNTSTFTGDAGESYVLEWTVTTSCGSTNDQVNISFDLCSPQPSQANAGPDQVNVTGTSTTLAAIAPTAGTGQWSILSGSGGNVLNVSSNTSTFTGDAGESYVLEWTVTTICGSTSDQVNISFDLCSPQPSPANAGVDMLNVPADSVILAATPPTSGFGQWTINSGTGGSFSNTTSATSIFHGEYNVSYELVWTVTTSCGSNSDVVNVSFVFQCGQPLVDSRDGKVYPTLQFGNQCWMAASLNYGTQVTIASGASQSNPVQEKFCFNNLAQNCETYGAMYQWEELMDYSTQEGVQGLCPNGWHIPTDYEWHILESYLDPTVSATYSSSYMGWMGTDIGTKLKVNGSSGMDLLLSGQSAGTTFMNLLNFGYYATSTTYQTTPGDYIVRKLEAAETRFKRTWNSSAYTSNVRCLKD
jgi:uncharacterized protein (TIGR02145 family)